VTFDQKKNALNISRMTRRKQQHGAIISPLTFTVYGFTLGTGNNVWRSRREIAWGSSNRPEQGQQVS
jgi:hypothetical protein